MPLQSTVRQLAGGKSDHTLFDEKMLIGNLNWRLSLWMLQNGTSDCQSTDYLAQTVQFADALPSIVYLGWLTCLEFNLLVRMPFHMPVFMAFHIPARMPVCIPSMQALFRSYHRHTAYTLQCRLDALCALKASALKP